MKRELGEWRDPGWAEPRCASRHEAAALGRGQIPHSLLVIVHVTGTNDCTFLFQAKRRLELGESGHQYLSDGLKTPKGKGRAALRSPDSPKSKDSLSLILCGVGSQLSKLAAGRMPRCEKLCPVLFFVISFCAYPKSKYSVCRHPAKGSLRCLRTDLRGGLLKCVQFHFSTQNISSLFRSIIKFNFNFL